MNANAAIQLPTRTARPPQLPRGSRTVAAVFVATLLLLTAGFVAWQAILIQTGQNLYGVNASGVAERLHRTPWDDPGVVISAAVATAVGLWLVVLAVVPPKRRFVQLRQADPQVVAGISRRHLRRALDGAAQRVDGVSAAETRVGRGTATIAVTSHLSMTGGLARSVQEAIDEYLRLLDPVEPVAVRVRLSGRGGS